jgi:superfamily II DNA or RNA helicase
MAASHFTTFLESFDDDPQRRGTQWEHVCKWFLETDPVYRAQLKKVWLWKQWPGRWGRDAGIDLVAQAKDGTRWAIQAKAYAPDNAVTKKDMDSFLSESARAEFDHRLLIATTRHVSAAAIRASTAAEKPVSTLLRHDLDRREGLPWPVSFTAWAKGRIPKPKPKRPRPHQTKALRAVLTKLKHHDRGQLILACGTGKTLTALWLHERLKASRTVVLVPSLSLLGQTLQEWVANAKTPFETLPVCSDDTVRRVDHDALMSSTLDLGYPSTTDPKAVRAFLKRRGPRVVFATYQSSPVIANALARTKQRFDLLIADEAHRCAGVVSSDFSTALDNKKIPARKRVFLTATPRYYTARVVNEAKQEDLEVASMNDEAVFGPVFHRLAFAEAIEKDLLTDYRVVIVGIDDDRYRRYAEQGRLLTLDGMKQTDARTLAAHIGLAKTMRTYDMERVISFHGRVSGATQFARTLPAIIDWMPRRERPSGQVWAEPVSGAMSSGDRKTKLDRLRAVETGERGILSNARCLGEGIDVPTLDGIAFVDPKHSQVDIVQAVGRAIRKGDGKQTATIVIPVFVDATADGEEVLDASAYRAIASVLRALRDHDEELADELDALRRDLGQRPSSRVVLPQKLVLDLPRVIGKEFSTAIGTAVVQLTTASWEAMYGQLVSYTEQFGLAHVSSPLKRSGDRQLHRWVNKQRSRKQALASDRRIRLEALPGWTWDARETRWEEMFERLDSYVKTNGHSRVPRNYRTAEGHHLGFWVTLQRARRDTVSKERQSRLEELSGWTWHVKETQWEETISEIETFAHRHGHLRIPIRMRGMTTNLVAWMRDQIRDYHEGRLTPAKQQKLSEIPGWTWTFREDRRVSQWQSNYQILVKYAKNNDTARVPHSYVTPDGFRLGAWVKKQKQRSFANYPERKNQLEALPGWSWSPLDDEWERNFELLVEYVKEFGNARVPQAYRTSTGDQLGVWCASRRHRRHAISPDRLARLEALPGWTWDPHQVRWDAMYQHLLDYVKEYGDAQVVNTFRTESGIKLGHWVSNQRGKRYEMSEVRRRRLESLIGWVWSINK